jgi:hypothetical protein
MPYQEPLEVCWQMLDSAGALVQCAICQVGTGVAVCVCCDADNRTSTTPVKDMEEGRARAATLKRILLEDGAFEETHCSSGRLRFPRPPSTG